MTADQRHPFEYIFTDVNFINQSSASNNQRQQLYVSNSQNEYQNSGGQGQSLVTYATSTNTLQSHNSLFPNANQDNFTTSPGGTGQTSGSSIQIEVDTDDLDFAPSLDGELMSGCRKCGIDYGSSTELKLHFGAVHSRQTFECCVCNKLFIRRHGFLVHIKRFHEDVTAKSYPCPFCEQIYTNPDSLNEHCGLQHREPNPICPLCSAQVPGEGGMKLHIEKEHSVQIVTQVDSVGNCDDLDQHQQQPLPLPAPVEVEITTDVNAATAASYKKIKRKWPQEKSHQCNLCPYETNRAERLRVHILGVHNDHRTFPCDACDKSFKQKDKLSRHIASVHLQQRPFQCDFCIMAFARKDEQTRHLRIVHMGEKVVKKSTLNNKANKANKAAVDAVNVEVENNMIVNEEDMDGLLNHLSDSQQTNLLQQKELILQQCPHCSYQCERTDKLKIHILSLHSDSRPFPCNFCEKRFKLKDKLKMHVNTVHLKRKPFECRFCNQVFGRKDAAKRHERLWCSNRPAVSKNENITPV